MSWLIGGVGIFIMFVIAAGMCGIDDPRKER